MTVTGPGVRIPLSPLEIETHGNVGFFMHYVYIIQSEFDESYYKGYSENPIVRLSFHNKGLSPYTSVKVPWKLVAVFSFASKKEALQKEKKIKKYNTRSLQALIASKQNILQYYLEGLENR